MWDMKKSLVITLLYALIFLIIGSFGQVLAKEVLMATPTALQSGGQATPSAVSDLTVPKVKMGRMTALLATQKVNSWYPLNFMKVGIRRAVESGVSINTVVLLFLFPMVASLVAFSRQVVGLNGFG